MDDDIYGSFKVLKADMIQKQYADSIVKIIFMCFSAHLLNASLYVIYC